MIKEKYPEKMRGHMNIEVMKMIRCGDISLGFVEYICLKCLELFKIRFTRERRDNVVMLSESAYNNLMENLYVRSDPTCYNELLKSIDQLKMGKGITKELLDE
ncbi:hypothetical protein KPL37_00015 [Clostridium frigoris]|uniref:Antitoxin n=1 Tax=Clostridium frigoris TaxID=205327 RepID=A0ABS6BMJ6_9CLOT|nr:hypothetical protein [Clostridium frigoris]MBU3158161.1 hypothetical protein [Clostridium frigoris]